tara:strand:+ start:1321 stop:1692 length:372 start_codon:yes stop_codon:yes gene_type:complete
MSYDEAPTIIYRSDLYRSKDVSNENSHKLYWLDIVSENNKYIVYGYAQLCSAYGAQRSARQYRLGAYNSLHEAENKAHRQLTRKTRTRGYVSISKRDIEKAEDVTISNETLVEFLNKYSHAIR